MGQVLAVVTLPKKSGILKDAVKNSFAFTTGTVPPSAAELSDIDDAIQDFYNDNGSAGVPVNHWLGTSLDQAAAHAMIDYYDLTGHLDGSPHGSPIARSTFTLGGPASTDGLPSEVAACLSYHSAFGTDLEESGAIRPKARDRGRIYLGPLAQNAVVVDATTKEVRLTPNAAQTFVDAGQALISGPTLVTWVLWSRKSAALKPVVSVSCDNAFDTQRRRGQLSTVKITSP